MLAKTLAAATAFALSTLSSPADALGTTVDINIVDRVSGETLPMYWHDGRWWVPGKPGNRYAVSLTNRSGVRTMAVISIDGVNVVSGETAAHDQTGYVLAQGQQAQITGWRKNLARVAAFEFTALPDSYAARTGRPDNIGVIGVAVFREKPRYVAPPAPAITQPSQRSRSDSPQESSRDATAGQAAAKSAAPANEATADSASGLRREQRLGTGHGRSEQSPTQYVEFERAQAAPDEMIVIHYDSRDNLIAMGAIPVPRHRSNPTPNPFPGPVGFVADPPRRW
jgi:hypothetical protein